MMYADEDDIIIRICEQVQCGVYIFTDCLSLTVTVTRNSYAEQYCVENGIKYTYEDAEE